MENKKIYFHPHALTKIGVKSQTWFCDSITDGPAKTCFSGHKKEHVIRKEVQYKCGSGCNYTICENCLSKYADSEYQQI